jgi:coenzyme F420-reducing hydrogenase delta subunit
LLAFSGIDEERLLCKWVSSAEAPEFVEVVNGFIQTLRGLGPSPLRKGQAGQEAA